MLTNWLKNLWTIPSLARNRRFSQGRYQAARRAGVPLLVAGERLEERALLAPYVLTTGSASVDANLTIAVDGYGAYGTAAGSESGSADYNPIGTIGSASTTFLSYMSMRIGSTGSRQELSARGISSQNPVVTGTPTQGDSSFTINGLAFNLTQSVRPSFDSSGNRQGSILQQIYSITNTTSGPLDFELIRYIDGDLDFDGSLVDGGGHLITASNVEFLFETDAGGSASTATTFMGIAGLGGTAPTTGRYEILGYSSLASNISSGASLANTIFGDSTGDGFVDPGAEYDLALGLQNTFTLQPGESTDYTAVTAFGTGAPTSVTLAPIITLNAGPLNYTENAAPTPIAPQATVDGQGQPNFNGGTLTMTIANSTADDQMGVANIGTGTGQISVAFNTVSYEGVPIATYTGGVNGAPIVFTLNANATPTATQALLRAITYFSTSENPSTTPKTVTASLSNGQGATSSDASQPIIVTPVNDGPSIALSRSQIAYLEGGAPVTVDPGFTFFDVDSTAFNTATLTAVVSNNGTSSDTLEVFNQGTGPGQVGVSGSTISYGGTAIGTFTGGTGGTQLVVTFNASATPEAVQAVGRAVAYSNTGFGADIAVRTIQFQASDDFQALSNTASLTVIPPTVQIYRSYDVNSKYHFFTTSLFEFANTVSLGWLDESLGRPGFSIFDSAGAGRVPVFRMYSPPNIISRATQRGNQYHYITASSGERDFLVSIGWTYERVEGYIYPFQAEGTTDVFRLYNTISGEHLFTAFAEERDAILSAFPGIWQLHSSLGFAFAGTINLPSSSLQIAGASASAAIANVPVTAALPQLLDETPVGGTFSAAQGDDSFSQLSGFVAGVAPDSAASQHAVTVDLETASSDSTGTLTSDADVEPEVARLDAWWVDASQSLLSPDSLLG